MKVLAGYGFTLFCLIVFGFAANLLITITTGNRILASIATGGTQILLCVFWRKL